MESVQKSLVFHEDKIKSAVIKSEDGKTLYMTETDTWRMYDLTELKHASGLVVAKLEWHSTSQNKITIGRSTEKAKLGKFLQQIAVSDNETSVSSFNIVYILLISLI